MGPTKALPECRFTTLWMHTIHVHAFTTQNQYIHIWGQTIILVPALTPVHYCQWRCGTPSFSCHCTPGQSGTLHPGGKGRHISTCPMYLCVCYQCTPICVYATNALFSDQHLYASISKLRWTMCEYDMYKLTVSFAAASYGTRENKYSYAVQHRARPHTYWLEISCLTL